jgi:hypothetical protein
MNNQVLRIVTAFTPNGQTVCNANALVRALSAVSPSWCHAPVCVAAPGDDDAADPEAAGWTMASTTAELTYIGASEPSISQESTSAVGTLQASLWTFVAAVVGIWAIAVAAT